MAIIRTTALLSLLLLAATISLFAAGVTARKSPEADWKPIKDVKDPRVQAVVLFAVKEHYEESHIYLKLVKVVSGETQKVDGINYKLIITAYDGLVTQDYETVVWVGKHSYVLKSLRPRHEPPSV